MECLLYVWYFIFEAPSALCQICIHVAIFPILLSVQECHTRIQRNNVRDRVLEGLEGSLNVTVRTADVFLDIGLENQLMVSMSPRNQRPLTMKGAFGIPRGFFSCPNIDVEAIALLGGHCRLDLSQVAGVAACSGRSWRGSFLYCKSLHSTSMSRLIVKNLPPNLTAERLRKHFEQRGAPPGTITDFKIARKPDGTSRRFAFIGFKTDKEAAAARDWFDRTFINSARISVTIVEV